jgi:GNAT superfamily N-acetyltransferase
MFRHVTADDLRDVVDVSIRSGLFDDAAAPALEQMVRDHLAGTTYPDGIMMLWDANDVPVGVIYVVPRPFADRVWELLLIAVDARHHRHGIGSDMLTAVEDMVRANGTRLLLIETSDADGFERTRAFYARHAYDHVATIPDYFTDGEGKASFVKRVAASGDV